MKIDEALFYKYSNVIPERDYKIQTDENGVDFIAEWYLTDIPQPTLQEIDQWFFEAKKEEKLTILKQDSFQETNKGFTSTVTGHTYEFDEFDQSNFTQQMLLLVANPSITSVAWKTVDVGVVNHTRDEFFAVINDANIHKRSILQKFWTKETELKNANTVEEIEAIVW